MAMLAAPRRRKRVVNLRSNNPWSQDSNKFGQKMLEKMGWESGRGLGKDENGMTDHIKVRFKDDNAGLGFKDKNDQWTEHDCSFSALLQTLNGGKVNDDDKLHSAVSLEEKSKKLKSRLHYKKFTRGKDISQYSKKDLANIFGKKTLTSKRVIVEKKSEAKVESVDTTNDESNYSFIASGNINDYFKSKLSKKQTKLLSKISEENTPVDDDRDFAFRGFSITPSDKLEDPVANNLPTFMQFCKASESTDDNKCTELSKEKKNNIKVNGNDTADNNSGVELSIEMNSCDKTNGHNEKRHKKKSKKNKKAEIDHQDAADKIVNEEYPEKKKRKLSEENIEIVHDENPEKKKRKLAEENIDPPLKKKKNKQKEYEYINDDDADKNYEFKINTSNIKIVKISKKSKKAKNEGDDIKESKIKKNKK